MTQPQTRSNLKMNPEADADADFDIKALVATYMRQIAQKELEEMHFDASRDAVRDLEEAADDLKADLNETKNEGIIELQNASETSLNTFQDIAAEVVKQMAETLEGHADDAYTEVWDDISDLAAIKETMSDKMKRRILMRGRQVLEKEKGRRIRLGAACKQDQGRDERV
jgi:predicted XRE-type DNA-binding protein